MAIFVEKPANIDPEVVDSYDLDETLIPEKLETKSDRSSSERCYKWLVLFGPL